MTTVEGERVTVDDQAARDAVLNDLKSTLFVEAGAGTGKTTALVGRIVKLVESGVLVRQIAAITFTEAAAAELKDRVRQKLDERRMEAGTGSDIETRCRIALGELDGAALQTLHAFAQRILTGFPLEAGLPPRIEISDEIRAGIEFNEDWARLMDEMLRGDDASLARAFMLRLEVKHLRAIAQAFHHNLDRIERAVFPDVEAPVVDAQPVLEQIGVADAELARLGLTNETSPLIEHIKALRILTNGLRAAPTEDDVLSMLANHLPLTAKRRSSDNTAWKSAKAKDDAHDALTAAEAAREAVVSSARTACLMPILRRLQRFTLARAAERRSRGVLQFDDLLVLAARLLRNNGEVRKAMAARFSHILIDEFQDTDPLQLEIATLLAASTDDVEGLSWEQIPVDEGKLFFVGDPKQSIYRFRRADILLYQKARARFGEQTDGLTDLTANFRSCQEILTFVNLVFDDLIGPTPKPGQPAYKALTGGRAAPIEGTAVHLFGGPLAKDLKVKVDQMREVEAADMVKLIGAIRGGWGVTAPGGGIRPAKLNDIAVLVPTRVAFQSLERALDDADIPYRLESRSLLYGTQEVVDLTNILAAIDDPTDEVSVVAALRSPAFACGDDDLYEFVKAGGHWDYTRKPPEMAVKTPVPAAMQTLRDLHASRWWYTVSELVERVMRERRLFEVAVANRRPRESWQRLRFVLEQARGFSEAGGTTLRQFVEWLQTQAKTGARVTESVVPEADDDAIRVLTIHSAKGLEFPIVMLAGLDRPLREDRSIAIWETGSDTPQVRVGTRPTGYFDTPGFDAVKGYESEMGALEDIRLYYVAATRARDHLVVSLYHKENDKNATAAGRTYMTCTTNGLLPESLDGLATPQPAAAEIASGQDTDDPIAARTAWIAKRAKLIEASARTNTLAATTIAKQAAGEPPEKQEQADPEQPWRRGRAGTSIGRAVHAVLQSFDLATGEGLEDAAGAQSVAEGIPERLAEIVDLARKALASQAVRSALASGRFWRELYVAADVDGTVIEGFIDLLYETSEGLVIVDYKTDEAGSDEQVNAALERYELQGAAYALALERAMPGRKVAACCFVFVRPSREERIADLPDAMRRVSELLAKSATAVAAPA